MSDENVTIDGFGEAEQDAIGEIMNITTWIYKQTE